MTAQIEGERRTSAREKVLIRGLVDWVELEQVHNYVASEHGGDPLSTIQEATLKLIRSLIDDDLCELGALDADSRFVAWDCSLDESIRALRDVYVKNFDDDNTWPWFCWLNLTDRGRQVAEAVQSGVRPAESALAAEKVLTEQRRLAAVSSLVGVVAEYVDDLSQVEREDLPGWLTELTLPVGWRLAEFAAGNGVQPARVAVCGPQPDGRWDASETISLFAFTGNPPADIVRSNSDRALRELNTELGDAAIVVGPPSTEVLDEKSDAGMIAVRSSGYFVLAGRWVWAQFGTYIVGSDTARNGRMLQQSIYIDSVRLNDLSDDIARLTDSVYQAFRREFS